MRRSVVLKRLLHDARPYMPRIIVSMLLGAIAGTGMVAFAPAFRVLIDQVITNPHHNIVVLWQIVGALLLVNLLSSVAGYGAAYLTAWSGQRLVADLRVTLLDRVLHLPSLTFDQWRPGEFLARFTNDLSLMSDAISVSFPQLVQVVITFVLSLAYMFYTDWVLTLVLLVVAPLVSLAVASFTKRIALSTTEAQTRIASLTANLAEVLQAQRIVKAFCREEYEIERFRKNNQAFFFASLRLTHLAQLQVPIVGMMIVVTLLAIVVVSVHEVIVGRMDQGSVFQFWTLVTLSINPMNRIASYMGELSRGLIGATRIYELIDLDIEEEVPHQPAELHAIDGALHFSNVTFQYPSSDVPILSKFQLEIPAGSVVAFVGPSGSGKTTIAQLVTRFYDVQEGALTLDGVDVRRIPLSTLRSAIGIVAQEPQLFHGTIAENIRYGRLDATDEDLQRAAREANAEEFILTMPEGYQTMVGERGMRLSGGQRQRIAIARALVRQPRILILDEATSALDSHSERLIEEALDRAVNGRTTMIIAHRLSTIRRADRIVYLDRGSIREVGTHHELLEQKGFYADLFAAQVR